MASDLRYEYSPITEADGIRLIELQPAEDPSAPLRCSLIHKKLSACGDGDIFGLYVALSYVWGNPEKSKNILVDGRRLGITSNLHDALSDLRDEKRALTIWADGVCINQEDDVERAVQIRLMGRIYASAPHTIIYLGRTESTAPESMCLAAIREGTYVKSDARLSSIFMNEWFNRVWVFQEFVYSRNPWLQCGRMRLRWDLLLDVLGLGDLQCGFAQNPLRESTNRPKEIAAFTPPGLSEERYHIIRDMQRARKLHFEIGSTDSVDIESANYMANILRARRGFGVTDPRDMIFAHVGFTLDGSHMDFAVDYSKTTVEVYTRSALHLVEAFGVPFLLECVGRGDSSERLGNLPSWVPDWTKKMPRNLYSSRDTFLDFTPRLPQLIPMFSRKSEPKAMICIFSWFDTVRFISSTLSVNQIPQETRQNISRLAISDTVSHSIEDIDDLSKAICQVWSDLVNNQDILDVHRDTFSYYINKNTGNMERIPFYLHEALREGRKTNLVDGKRLARMASGRLALVPGSAQEGDVIATLPSPKQVTYDIGISNYLFHPIQPDSDYRSMNDKIYRSAKEMAQYESKLKELEWLKAKIEEYDELGRLEYHTTRKMDEDKSKLDHVRDELKNHREEVEELKRLEAISEEFEALESSVLHCRFIGECFVEPEFSLRSPRAHNPSKSSGILVAIH